jgi:hypothetical protein
MPDANQHADPTDAKTIATWTKILCDLSLTNKHWDLSTRKKKLSKIAWAKRWRDDPTTYKGATRLRELDDEDDEYDEDRFADTDLKENNEGLDAVIDDSDSEADPGAEADSESEIDKEQHRQQASKRDRRERTPGVTSTAKLNEQHEFLKSLDTHLPDDVKALFQSTILDWATTLGTHLGKQHDEDDGGESSDLESDTDPEFLLRLSVFTFIVEEHLRYDHGSFFKINDMIYETAPEPPWTREEVILFCKHLDGKGSLMYVYPMIHNNNRSTNKH